jgi:hypothetical protein
LDTEILDAICIHALYHGPQQSALLTGKKSFEDDFWFFWPTVIAITYQMQVHDQMIGLLTSDLSSYGPILDLLELFDGFGLAYCEVLRDFVIQKVLETRSDEDILLRSFVALYYKFKTSPFSPALVGLACAFLDDSPVQEEASTNILLTPFDPVQLKALVN